MTLEEAFLKLVEALTKNVRPAFDAGADDWRRRELHAYREFSRAAGMDRKLLDPLQKMLMEADEAILQARGVRRAGMLPLTRAKALVFASACVTELNRRAERPGISAAIALVAKTSGIDGNVIRKFRDEINREKRTPDVLHEYKDNCTRLQGWSEAEILGALGGLAAYL